VGFQLISFDLDDTLWQSAPTLERAERRVYEWLAEFFPPITDRYSIEEIVARRRDLMRTRPDIGPDFTRIRHTSLALLAEEFGFDATLAERAMEVFFEARSEVELFGDVVPALRSLGRRYRIVAVSNGNADVRRTGIGQFFELAVSPTLTGASKPDRAIFEYVLERTGVDRTAVVHVGDEPETDIAGALGAGMTAVWVNRDGRAWPAGQPHPHASIASLAELARVLAELEAGRGPGSG
jgi:putative hydrolase of the HAD superfamily